MRRILMSAVVLLIFSASIILFQISCKKGALADIPAAKSTINGLWIGTYDVQDQPNLGKRYFSLIIKPDGTMINDSQAEDQQHLSPGKWTFKNDTLKCDFTCVYGLPGNVGVREIAVAVLDKSGNLQGKWKNYAAPVDSGKIVLTKVN